MVDQWSKPGNCLTWHVTCQSDFVECHRDQSHCIIERLCGYITYSHDQGKARSGWATLLEHGDVAES